jgi:hypothetical protein
MEITYKRLYNCLIENNRILSRRKFTDRDLDIITKKIRKYNRHFIRLHSIGELINTTHLDNFYRICESMPDHHFGLWSKRADLFRRYEYCRPDNLKLIYSNPAIDRPIDRVPLELSRYGFTGVFNVVSYDYAINNRVKITCRGKCIECLKCYTGPAVVTELIKKDQTSIRKGFLPDLPGDLYEV